jgi:oxygen-independent coproporphyrinogen-3 oxidase
MNPTEARNSEPIRHLYVHFPFCARVCPYCAFYKTRGNAAEVGRFCEALVRELEQQETAALVPSTIYFGGGTPTALKTSQLEVILSAFHQRLDLSELKEWTIEANPGSVSARKATLLKKFGLNRVSLGVQSWDNDLLNLLGREHNAVQAEEVVFAFFATPDFPKSASI